MRYTLFPLALVMAVSGCSFMESKKVDYKSAGTVPSLEAPPDLVLPARDTRFDVPAAGPAGSATFSSYDKDRDGKTQAGTQVLLPRIDKVSIERAGSQRWLVVSLPAKDVWPVVKDFWQELGFIVSQESPETGIMETDWAENRAKVPQEGIRKWIGKALDFAYSTAERDKFRSRIETAADGRTEIYISHRGMVEVYEGTQTGSDEGKGRTMWQPRPADPELEAEMLARLMTRFGVDQKDAQGLLAEKGPAPQAALIKSGDAEPGLSLPDPFDRAWRRVGLALDRVGFVVEDRDRVAGTYFVRYADPEASKKKGFLDKLAFWRSDDSKAAALKYQVQVKESGGTTNVSVRMEDGKPARNETGNRIATLLYEQLK